MRLRLAGRQPDRAEGDLWPYRTPRTIPDNRWVTVSTRASAPMGLDRDAITVARQVFITVGGRYSTKLGIDVDGGEAEVERWFMAATLFGTRISAAVAGRTFRVLDDAGLTRIAHARHVPWNELVALLDRGGYARYDFRTATRLQALSEVVEQRYGGQVAAIGRRFQTYAKLREALDALPGWGPVTVELFLRELRGVWPGAQPPLDDRAARAAQHLGLLDSHDGPDALRNVARLARAGHLDLRDLESGLVRLTLAHHGAMHLCPGGAACIISTRHIGRRETG